MHDDARARPAHAPVAEPLAARDALGDARGVRHAAVGARPLWRRLGRGALAIVVVISADVDDAVGGAGGGGSAGGAKAVVETQPAERRGERRVVADGAHAAGAVGPVGGPPVVAKALRRLRRAGAGAKVGETQVGVIRGAGALARAKVKERAARRAEARRAGGGSDAGAGGARGQQAGARARAAKQRVVLRVEARPLRAAVVAMERHDSGGGGARAAAAAATAAAARRCRGARAALCCLSSLQSLQPWPPPLTELLFLMCAIVFAASSE